MSDLLSVQERFFFYVFLAGNPMLVKSLTYVLLANLDFLGKKYQNCNELFSEVLYREVFITMNGCLFFSHLTTCFCLLICWVLFLLFIKNGPMSLAKTIKIFNSYLPENIFHSFLTLTEKDQQTNKYIFI